MPRARIGAGWPAVLAVLVVLAALPAAAPPYYLSLLTLTFSYGIMAMSLDLLVGYTGLASLGQAAYFGVAAYTVGVLATRASMGFWPVSGLGILLAAATAAVFGLLAIRATGPYFLIITLALGQIIWGLAYRWVSMSGGDNGLSGIPRPAVGFGFNLTHITHFYYFALAVTALAGGAMYLLVASPFGLTLRGIRESESRMRVLGYNVWLHKYLSFVISGAFAGVGGVLYAYYNSFVSPAAVSLVASSNALLMVVLGGTGTLWGPLVGAAALVFLQNLISGITQRWVTILGAILVLVVLYAPRGVVGAGRDVVARAAARSRPRAAAPTAEQRL